MRRGCVLSLVILSAIAFVLSVLFYVFVWPETRNRITSDITFVIEDALEQYKVDQGHYPEASDEAAVVGALYGQNPRQKDYLDKKMKSIIRNGQFTDYWKNPYRIEFPPAERARVISAGQDGDFGTDDDITSQASRAGQAQRGVAAEAAEPNPSP